MLYCNRRPSKQYIVGENEQETCKWQSAFVFLPHLLYSSCHPILVDCCFIEHASYSFFSPSHMLVNSINVL